MRTLGYLGRPELHAWQLGDMITRACPVCEGKGEPQFRRADMLQVSHCLTCRCWYVPEIPSSEQFAAYYSRYSSQHRPWGSSQEKLARRIFALTAGSSLITSELHSLLGGLAGKKILDVGFGKGALLSILHRSGASVEGIDLDPAAIRFATEVLRIDKVTVASLAEYHAEIGTYDAILMVDVVEHLIDPMTVLRRARSLLSPGGFLVVWTPAANSFAVDPAPIALCVDLEHIQYFDTYTMLYLAACLDFEPVHIETIGFPDVALRRPDGTQWRRLFSVPRRLVARLRGSASYDGNSDRLGAYHLFSILRATAQG